ncbi:MAG: uracil-DNA glycosylase [Vicinamibacterales bacterium]
MDARQVAEHLRFYQELGVAGISRDPRWRQRQRDLPALQAEDVAVTVAPAQPLRIVTLQEIRADLGDCTRCKLHTLGRSQIVFGVGHPRAELMFVGEAPGADEDIQGVPFVGRAGQLLTKMIEAMGFSREDVYIANVIKCRPPENRNPDPDEVLSCEPFLFRQIDSIRPQVIVALGAFAAKVLLKSDQPISRLRGQVHDYHGAKLIPTFHPSYLLRSPGQKKYAWDDLKRALSLMGRTVPRGAGDGTA